MKIIFVKISKVAITKENFRNKYLQEFLDFENVYGFGAKVKTIKDKLKRSVVIFQDFENLFSAKKCVKQKHST